MNKFSRMTLAKAMKKLLSNDLYQQTFERYNILLVSESYKYNQFKWLYSALSGFCVAYFLALFSGSSNVNESCALFMASSFFAVCLPVFTAFAIAHVYIAEIGLSVEQCEPIFASKWVSNVLTGNFFLLFFAVASLIAFFSLWFMVFFFLSTFFCFVCFGILVLKLRSNAN